MDIKQFIRIKLESTNHEDCYLSERLASLLLLPPPAPEVKDVPFIFVYDNSILKIIDNTDNKLSNKGVFVDFLSGKSLFRFKNDRRISQPLAKAVGIKKGIRPTILDATAGFGGDGFVLASLGCFVVMLERSPVMWALLEDGLRRVFSDPAVGVIVQKNISLFHSDSIKWIASSEYRYDTIYLDPMYPHRRKSALNKLNMRLLRNMVGDDTDSAQLFETALQHALKRVVVKRPADARTVSEATPSYVVKSKNSRYDIYLTTHL